MPSILQPMTATDTCVSCGARLDGDYCSRCGEKRADLRDLHLRRFLRDSVESFFNLDATAWRSFAALVRRPGQLTAEYVAGRRRPWLSPIQLFLIVNIVYFFLATTVVVGGTLTTTFRSQLHGQRYSEYARDVVRQRFAAEPEETFDFEAFESRFNFATEQYAKSLVLVLVPAFAVLFALLFAGRGVPFVQHLVFAMHYMAFLLLLLLALGVVIVSAAGLTPSLARLLNSETVIALLMMAVLVPYLTLAFRRVYGTGVVGAVLRAVIVFGAIPFVLMGYRFLLFVIVIRAI
jgi:hypothetical protein